MVNRKITVIVPVYNCEKYLEECIESLINQTYSNIEIILVDDGSEDRSQEICLHYANVDNRVCYFRKENGGVSSARNYGISKAQGEYIAFADADDCMTKNMLYEMNSLMENAGSDIVIVSYFCDRMLKPEIDNNTEVESFDGVSAVREMHIGNKFQGHLWNKLFRKQLFTDTMLNEKITINEDMLLVQTLFLKSNKIVFLNKPLYFYRTTNNSALRSKFKESNLSGRQACLLMREEIQDKCSELLLYANKSIVYADISLLEKLYYSKMTSSHHFNMLQKEIVELNCKEIYELICKNNIRKKIIYKTILMGKLQYVCVKKMAALMGSIKNRMHGLNKNN